MRLPEAVIAEILTYIPLPSLLCKKSPLEVNRAWHAAARKAQVKLHQVVDEKTYIKDFARLFKLAMTRFPLLRELQIVSLYSVPRRHLLRLCSLHSLSIVRFSPPTEDVGTLCKIICGNPKLSRLHMERWSDDFLNGGHFQRVENSLLVKQVPTFNGCAVGLCAKCHRERFLWPLHCFDCRPVQQCRVGCGTIVPATPVDPLPQFLPCPGCRRPVSSVALDVPRMPTCIECNGNLWLGCLHAPPFPPSRTSFCCKSCVSKFGGCNGCPAAVSV